MKRKIFLILLFLVIINVYKLTNDYPTIPNSSIRLRVIPNTNNKEDIIIKEKIKKYLENNIYNLVKNTNKIEEVRSIINNNIPNIENNIDKIFENNNYHMPYKVNFGYNYFPKKEYKGKEYKEGYYESLVISIGEANGDNWWCVLFPNFCLIDTKENHTYKSYIIENILKNKKKSNIK